MHNIQYVRNIVTHTAGSAHPLMPARTVHLFNTKTSRMGYRSHSPIHTAHALMHALIRAHVQLVPARRTKHHVERLHTLIHTTHCVPVPAVPATLPPYAHAAHECTYNHAYMFHALLLPTGTGCSTWWIMAPTTHTWAAHRLLCIQCSVQGHVQASKFQPSKPRNHYYTPRPCTAAISATKSWSTSRARSVSSTAAEA